MTTVKGTLNVDEAVTLDNNLDVKGDTSIQKLTDYSDKSVGDSLENLENQDLLKFGMIPEFIGRLPVIATLEELDEDMLIQIMQEPKNALLKQWNSA